MSGIDWSAHFNNGTYSDFTIRCGTTTFKTLKMILCIQSEFFGNACYGHFKEAWSDEIDMKDNHVLLVEALLSFMYKCSYDVPQPEALKISEVCFHAAMITIADKYQLINLKGFAGIQLRNAVDKRKFTLQELLTKALAISQSLPDKDLGARHHLAYNISREFALSLRSGAPEQYINSTNALEKAVSADPAFAKQVVNWSLAMISTTMVV